MRKGALVAAVTAGLVAVCLPSVAAPTTANSGPTFGPPSPAYDVVKNQPVADSHYPDTGFAETDVLHYKLGFAWGGSSLKAIANIKIRATRATSTTRLTLSPALTVTALTVNGKKATFARSGRTLTITSDALAQDSVNDFLINYNGVPKSVPMPSARGGQLGWVNRKGSVSTLQEPYGAYTWYPVNEHPSDKAFYDVRITTPDGVQGVFNGVQTSKTSKNGFTSTIWKLDSPAASYLTTIAIDPFKVDEQTMSDGKKFYIWYTNEDASYVKTWRDESKRAYEWLIKHAGENQFSSMGMVITSADSAMETQTMMTMGRDLMRSNYRGLIIHEMAHQWFGDTVTTKTWRDTWLNEGWTMYFDEDYRGILDPERSARTCASTVAQAGQAGNPKANMFAMSNVYQCPIPAIAQLRKDLGDAKFYQVAAGWPREHRYTSQDRAAFLAYLKRATGKDYSAVFAKWLDNVGSARAAHNEAIQPKH